MRWRLAIAVLAMTQIAAVVPPRPIERLPPSVPPAVSAPAWILYDETNGVVLDGAAVDQPRPMASTTKIMTGLLAIERGDMGDLVVVSQRAADVGESEIGLVAGERVRLDMLVNALLIRSANDASIAIAEHIGGSVEGFVDMMNQRAAELGLDETTFANPHGLDAEGHTSSPRDLLALARVAMEHEAFREIAGTTRYRITDAPDGTVRVAEATNELLTTYRGAAGVKTGFTLQSGLVLVGAAERDGRMLYVVVMGSEGSGAHFRDSVRLLDHGFTDLLIVDTIGRGTPFRLLRSGERTEMVATASLHTLLFVSALEQMTVEAPAEPIVLDAPDEIVTADLPGVGEAVTWLVGGLVGG